MISSLLWRQFGRGLRRVSWALKRLDDSPACTNSSTLSLHPENSWFWSHFVQFPNRGALWWHTDFPTPMDLLRYLTPEFCLICVYSACMWPTSTLSLRALCMTCLVNASLEVGQSALVLIVWACMLVCYIVILSWLTYLQEHFLALALPLLFLLFTSLHLKVNKELLIPLSSGARAHLLWPARSTGVWSGSLCFVFFNHVRPYWIYK